LGSKTMLSERHKRESGVVFGSGGRRICTA
jgi:hypothetical protein